MELRSAVYSGATVLVFVHEMGHYLAARRCGVRVEVFSIGFGPEIFGFTAKSGTRWKFSAIPFGGYVRMFGEQAPDNQTGDVAHSEQEIEVSFYNKSLRQRAWIVFAGPLANFLFAIVVLAGLFSIVGQPYTPADVGKVIPGSAAEEAGLKPGDIFVKIDSTEIKRFEQVVRIVQLSPGRRLSVIVTRDGNEVRLTVVPKATEVTQFGSKQTIGRLGVSRSGGDMVFIRHDPLTAVWEASVRTVVLTGNILDALGQIISGQRNAKELGRPRSNRSNFRRYGPSRDYNDYPVCGDSFDQSGAYKFVSDSPFRRWAFSILWYRSFTWAPSQ